MESTRRSWSKIGHPAEMTLCIFPTTSTSQIFLSYNVPILPSNTPWNCCEVVILMSGRSLGKSTLEDVGYKMTTETKTAADPNGPVSSQLTGGKTLAAIVAGLLIIHFALAAGSAAKKSATYDEIMHLSRGYVFWKTGDFRLSADVPPLPSLWMTLPLFDVPVEYPPFDNRVWHESKLVQYGLHFFFSTGNDPPRMLGRGRALIALVSVGLGLAIFLWSRALFGVNGGLLSLTLYAFSPTMLAHARLATTDLITAAFFLFSIAGVWAALCKLTWPRAIGSALALSGLFLCKLTAVLAIPIVALLAVIRVCYVQPLPIELGKKSITASKVSTRFLAVSALLLLQAIVIYGSIWCAYGLRYETFAHNVTGNEKLMEPYYQDSPADRWELQYGDRENLKTIVEFCREHELFPEMYLYMVALTGRMTQRRVAFIDGEHGLTGFKRFFPLTFLYKTPLALLAILAAAMIATRLRWRDQDQRAALEHAIFRTLPIWIMLVVYWYFVINAKINIGHRHILATYPPLFVLGGAAAGLFGSPRRWVKWIVPGLVLIFIVCSLRVFPHYLAYFNVIAGGPGNGYRHLVDSSLDWGQDIEGLGDWLENNRGDADVYLSYFGNGPPRYYGVETYAVPFETFGYAGYRSIGTGRLTPGIYCISATMLQQVYSPGLGAWSADLEHEYWLLLPGMRQFESVPIADEDLLHERLTAHGLDFPGKFARYQQLRFAKLCAYLRTRQYDDHVGYSILIYNVAQGELDAALY